MGYSHDCLVAGIKLKVGRFGNYWRFRVGGKLTYHPDPEDTEQGYLTALAMKEAAQRDDGDIGLIKLTTPVGKRVNDSAREMVRQYVESKLRQHAKGNKKASTIGDITEKLNYFSDWWGNKSINSVDESVVTAYYKLIDSRNCGEVRKFNIYRTFKSFLRWCYRQNLLKQLPRNLDLEDQQFSNKSPEHKPEDLFTRKEILDLLPKIPPRLRAYILLSLNCGFTQADISALKKSEVQNGRIIYRRTKVKVAPVINYKLWDITIQAIEAVKSEHPGELFFTTSEGLPLKTDKILQNGKRSVWDTIGKKWNDMVRKGRVPRKPYKFLRKTGATLIELSDHSMALDYYLGHKRQDMSHRHYVVTDGRIIEGLDRATDYIGKQLGLVKV